MEPLGSEATRPQTKPLPETKPMLESDSGTNFNPPVWSHQTHKSCFEDDCGVVQSLSSSPKHHETERILKHEGDRKPPKWPLLLLNLQLTTKICSLWLLEGSPPAGMAVELTEGHLSSPAKLCQHRSIFMALVNFQISNGSCYSPKAPKKHESSCEKFLRLDIGSKSIWPRSNLYRHKWLRQVL